MPLAESLRSCSQTEGDFSAKPIPTPEVTALLAVYRHIYSLDGHEPRQERTLLDDLQARQRLYAELTDDHEATVQL